MNLQNGYKIIYEKTADGKRTFYATKNIVCDPTVDDKIIEAEIGKYKLIYEKNGEFYGSATGIPSEDDECFTTDNFKKVFVEGYTGEAAAYNRRSRKATPAVEDPVVEPVVEETKVEE